MLKLKLKHSLLVIISVRSVWQTGKTSSVRVYSHLFGLADSVQGVATFRRSEFAFTLHSVKQTKPFE